MKMLPFAIRSTLIATLTLFWVACMGGCKSYQLGSPTELPFKSIYVKPVSNDSFAPQAQALLSGQLRKAFIGDGRVKIVTSAEAADAVLLVNLTEYNRTAAARLSEDTGKAADFDLTLYSEVSLYDQNKGNYFFKDRLVQETANAYANNPYDSSDVQTQDFLQSEYQAMPLLTRDLARKIANEVLSPW